MKVNELRIGNWVRIRESDTKVQVEAYMLNLSELSNCQPIPLTPKILEKRGFASNPYQDRYELGDLHFEYCGIRNIVWCEKYPHIKYLHQLQNLYFALTGEELTIKL